MGMYSTHEDVMGTQITHEDTERKLATPDF